MNEADQVIKDVISIGMDAAKIAAERDRAEADVLALTERLNLEEGRINKLIEEKNLLIYKIKQQEEEIEHLRDML